MNDLLYSLNFLRLSMSQNPASSMSDALTAPQDDDRVGARQRIAEELQELLRASGSETSTCQLVQLQCRLSEYRGGIVDMTEQAAMAAEEAKRGDSADSAEIVMITDLPITQMPHPLLLPDWPRLFNAAIAAEPKPQLLRNGEEEASLVVRRKTLRRAACRNAAGVAGPALGKDFISRKDRKGGKSDSASRSSSSEPSTASLEQSRKFAPLRPAYLGALQLLHQRQRQSKARKSELRKMEQAAEAEGPGEEALHLASPPPFKALHPVESVVSSVTEYLGCLAMDIPTNRVGGTATNQSLVNAQVTERSNSFPNILDDFSSPTGN